MIWKILPTYWVRERVDCKVSSILPRTVVEDESCWELYINGGEMATAFINNILGAIRNYLNS